MTAPATEHFSGPVDQSGMPRGVAVDETFIDPEAAVDEALRATHDTEATATEPSSEYDGVRTLGKHMLGLLENEEATEQQRLGARIVLMNGTPVERKILFLHDAFETARTIETDPRASLTETVREWDVLRSLTELGDAPRTVRSMMRHVERGGVIQPSEFYSAVQETMLQVVPHIPAAECAELLRAARREHGSLITGGLTDAKLLHHLAAKLKEADDLSDQALIAEGTLVGVDALSNLHGNEKRAAELADEAAKIRNDVSETLDPSLVQLSKDYDGKINRHYLSKAIDVVSNGVNMEAYSSLGELGRVDDINKYPAQTINRIAEFMGPSGSERREQIEELLLNDVYTSDKIEVLSLAVALCDKPELGLSEGDYEQLSVLASMLKHHEPEDRLRIENELASLAGKVDLGAALQVYQTESEVNGLLAAMRRGDTAALADLNGMLSSPAIVGMLKRGELTFYAASDTNVKHVFTDELYSAYDSLTKKRQLLVECAQDPAVVAICEDPATRRAFGDWVSSAMNANNHDHPTEKRALLNQIITVLGLDGARQAMADITSNNPAIIEGISMVSIVGSGTPESVLEKLQILASMPAGAVHVNLIAGLGYHAEAFDKLAELQSYGAMDYLGEGSLFGGNSLQYVKWFTDEQMGTMREKVHVLNDPEVGEHIAALKGTFAEKFSPDMFTSAPIGEWRALANGLRQMVQNEDIQALYADNRLLDVYGRHTLARAISAQENAGEAIARVGELFRTRKSLLEEMAAISTELSSGVIAHCAENSSSAYLESWQKALHDNPGFWKFISAEGAGYNLRGQIINGLAETDDPHEMTSSLTKMFTQQRPLWLLNVEIAKWAIKSESYHDGMMVDEIPISLPVSQALNGEDLDRILASGSLLRSLKDMTVEEKRQWLAVEGMNDEQIAELHTVAFNDLQQDVKETALAYRLFETIETSRSERMRQQANDRNAAFALAGANVWRQGMLTHFTRYEGARASLINGNLAGEMIGFKSQADNYPYNVDFVEANDEVMRHESHVERLEALASKNFGPVAMHYRREPGSFRYGEEFAVPERYGGQHRLLFGGIPATELSAMSVRQQDLIPPLKRDLVRAGLYVPLLDNDGKLVFTPAEFQSMRDDGNYDRVKPEVVDGAFMRENSQGGSNEGAEMYIPTANGEPERWYVKFAQDDDDHLWTEVLTDRLYRGVDPELVPDTKAIIIDGRFGRASKMVDPSGTVTDEGRNRGFILDAWVGGWDAVYNSNNLIPKSSTVALRIDNGNALDYRARGTKKGTGNTLPFGSIVAELEFGDNEDLGHGMRQRYLGLTDDNIREQVVRFGERATDEFIDAVVEDTRRSSADREFLKRTLKARRDYILTYFADL